jgi:hypothetical protein
MDEREPAGREREGKGEKRDNTTTPNTTKQTKEPRRRIRQ